MHPESESSEAPATSEPVIRSKRKRRALTPLALVAVLVLLVIGAGTAAAFNLPLFAMNANKSIGEMLPASTVFYISANLNPSGATKDNLDRIERAYTSQPSWKHIASTFNSQIKQAKGSTGDCYRKTKSQISDNVQKLGQDTALVMTGTGRLNISKPNGGSSNILTTLKRSFVVVAPLHEQVTLVDALSGFSFSLQQKSTSYGGTTIYKETFKSCGQASGGQAQTIYAALVKNWAVLGVVPEAIYPIIDTANGKSSALNSVPLYRTLMARLPTDHLGTYFVNGPSLGKMGLSQAMRRYAVTAPNNPFNSQNLTKALTAAALSVDSRGFGLTSAANNPSISASANKPAGAIASSLPSNVLGLFSTRISKKGLNSGIAQLESNPLSGAAVTPQLRTVIQDLTADLSGEVDLVLFNPGTTRMSASNPRTIPLALLWQVANEGGARAHLRDVINRLGLSGQVSRHHALDGTTYDSARGTGDAVRKGWAIVSPSIKDTLGRLSTAPTTNLSSSAPYQRVRSANFVPSAILYLDGNGLRRALENAILPTLSSSERLSYQNYILPWIAPIGNVSFSAGTTADHKISITNFYVDIH